MSGELHFHRDDDWDAALTPDGDGYIVVPLYGSRWQHFLAWLRRRPTVAVYPVQVHRPPTDIAPLRVVRSTVPMEDT